MRGYLVHLLFHLMAIIIGAACGLSAAAWWAGFAPAWLCFTALVVGVLLLVLQGLYIQAVADREQRSRTAGQGPPRSQPRIGRVSEPGPEFRSANRTMPDLEHPSDPRTRRF